MNGVTTLEAAHEEELSLLEEAKGFVAEAKAAQTSDLEEVADVMGKANLDAARAKADQVITESGGARARAGIFGFFRKKKEPEKKEEATPAPPEPEAASEDVKEPEKKEETTPAPQPEAASEDVNVELEAQ